MVFISNLICAKFTENYQSKQKEISSHFESLLIFMTQKGEKIFISAI